MPDWYQILVVDLLHEFELGVWKSFFTHLIRILRTYGEGSVQELNRRYVTYQASLRIPFIYLTVGFSYRQVPTFGRGTIRRFQNNVAEMKKLAAWNFEDMLQVSRSCVIFRLVTKTVTKGCDPGFREPFT